VAKPHGAAGLAPRATRGVAGAQVGCRKVSGHYTAQGAGMKTTAAAGRLVTAASPGLGARGWRYGGQLRLHGQGQAAGPQYTG